MFVSTNSLTGLHICPQALGGAGDTMSSVAAKARGMSHVHSFLVKRNVRLRQHAALKSLRIPAQNLETPVLKRDDTSSPCTNISTATASVQFLPGPETLEPLEIDTDTETTLSTATSIDFEGTWYNIPKVSSSPPCTLVDLSNYLSMSHSEDDALKRVDSDPLTRETSCDADSYGWESEYDRRLDCGNAKLVRSCHMLRYHRP